MNGAAETLLRAAIEEKARDIGSNAALAMAMESMDLAVNTCAASAAAAAAEATPEEAAAEEAAEGVDARSASSDPLQGVPHSLTPVVPSYKGVQSEIGHYVERLVPYAGAGFRGPRAIAHASNAVLGSSKLISNHYVDYGL